MLVTLPTFVLAVNGNTELDSTDGISVCDFIGPICNAIGITGAEGEGAGPIAQKFLRDRLNLGLSLLFIGIILISVFIIVQAGIKYIQSQGDEGKIQDAQKSIRSVFLGIGLLFVGVIGIVLVLVVFNGLGLLAPGGTDQDCGFNADTGVFECGAGTN